MRIATLALLVRNNEVLLAEKKSGAEIGSGKLNGPGGKLEPGESLYECLVRETQEEIGVTILRARKIIILSCFAAGTLHQEVHVYRVTAWAGDPVETESMHVSQWYPIDTLPIERMHEADRRWMRRALRDTGGDGAPLGARIFYREPGKGFEDIDFYRFDDP